MLILFFFKVYKKIFKTLLNIFLKIQEYQVNKKNKKKKKKKTFKLEGLNAGVMTCLCRTHSSPSAITNPFPNIDFLSRLNTDGFPQYLACTSLDNIFTNSGSAMYKNGSVPNQYVNIFPIYNHYKHITINLSIAQLI